MKFYKKIDNNNMSSSKALAQADVNANDEGKRTYSCEIMLDELNNDDFTTQNFFTDEATFSLDNENGDICCCGGLNKNLSDINRETYHPKADRKKLFHCLTLNSGNFEHLCQNMWRMGGVVDLFYGGRGRRFIVKFFDIYEKVFQRLAL
ncbi:hypothetical protein Trydic_g14498 [Trypoxylus dichotomus]